MERRLSGVQLCEGFTGHARHSPVRNAFRYPVLYIRFPAARAVAAARSLREILKVFSLNPGDYLLGGAEDLELRARELLAEHAGFSPDGISLLTIPRLFGYAFNPVSFWFCEKDGKLAGVLCEVNNTFGERHFYWVDADESGEWSTMEKRFHVSPFLPVEGFYRFRFLDEPGRTRVDIDYHGANGEKVLSTWIDVESRPLEGASALGLLVKYGWVTALVILRIHFQAIRLFLRRARFYPKPNPPSRKVS